jgi:cysteine desulfurase
MSLWPIYLDNNATTPVDERVVAAMMPYFTEKFGNAASASHSYGWEAKAAVENAREMIAALLGAKNPESLIFTSGTTESNNLTIKGVAAASKKRIHVISQVTEHESVLESLKAIQTDGHDITLVGVDSDGKVCLDEFRKAFRPNTALVSMMWANNEIGTLQNIPELLAITREHEGVLFHTDAAQAVGKVAVDLGKVDVDFLSFSAHKIYGPKGIGALYVAPRLPKIPLKPLFHGGGHEFGLRSGTLNVPAVVGLAKALEICISEIKEEGERQSTLREHLIQHLLRELDDCFLNGHATDRLAGNASFTVTGVAADELILSVPEIAISSGAACSSGGTEPSHVIQALGRTREEAKSTVRLSLGRFTTAAEIETTIRVLIRAVTMLRKKQSAIK